MYVINIISIMSKHQISQSGIKQQQNSQLYKLDQNSYEKISINMDQRQESPAGNTEINVDTEGNYNNQMGADIQKDQILSKTFTNFRSQLVRRDSNAELFRSNSKISMNQIAQSQKQPKHKKSKSILSNKQRNLNTAIQTKRNNKNLVTGLQKQKTDKKIQKLIKQSNKINDLSLDKKKQISARSLTSNIGKSVNIRVKGNHSNSKVSEKLNFIVKNKQFVDKKKQKCRSLSKSKTSNTHFTLNPKKSVPDQIVDYLKKREDVEIIQYFQEYKKQFFTRSKTLQDYIYNSDQPQKIKNTYMNENDNHFKCGLQTIMLKLFRNGTIVPKSYDNLRQEAVQEIEKWVIGWIHRKILYGKLIQDQQNQVLMVQDSLKHLEDYQRLIQNENTSF